MRLPWIEYRIRGEIDNPTGPNTVDTGAWLPLQIAGGLAAPVAGNSGYGFNAMEELSGNNPRTIEFWAKIDAFDGGELLGIGNADVASQDRDALVLQTSTNDDTLYMYINDGVQYKLGLDNAKGEWHHYALSYTGTVISMYYDGEPQASLPVNLSTTTDLLRIAYLLTGEVDELRIWSEARTAAQIAEFMHYPIDQTLQGADWVYPSPLLRYVQFDDDRNTPFEAVEYAKVTTYNPLAKTVSTIPMGYMGQGNKTTEQLGTVTWAMQDCSASFITQNGVDVVVSKITAKPHNINVIGLPGGSVIDQVLTNQYWATHRHDLSPVQFDLTLGIDDVTSTDQSAPQYLALLGRDQNTASDWTYITTAIAANDAMNTVQFNTISNFDQFMVLRLANLTAVEEISTTEDRNIRVYPNPVEQTSHLIVQIDDLETTAQLSVYDELGRVVKQVLLEETTTLVELSNLETGVYFYQIKGSNYLKVDKLVVKE